MTMRAIRTIQPPQPSKNTNSQYPTHNRQSMGLVYPWCRISSLTGCTGEKMPIKLGLQSQIQLCRVQAVQSSIKKARKCWARISCVLRAETENASPKTCGMFYKVTVQAILLLGSETWNLTSLALNTLKASIFGLRGAWHASTSLDGS